MEPFLLQSVKVNSYYDSNVVMVGSSSLKNAKKSSFFKFFVKILFEYLNMAKTSMFLCKMFYWILFSTLWFL